MLYSILLQKRSNLSLQKVGPLSNTMTSSSTSAVKVEDNCLLWGNRVVIQPQGCKLVLEELHIGHPWHRAYEVISKELLMVAGLDGGIEQKVRTCNPCQNNRKMPSTTPIHP